MGLENELRELFAFAHDTYGDLDIPVNNASVEYRPDEPLEYWPEVLQVDLLAAVYGTRLAIDAMRGRGGAIVNIGSVSVLGHGRLHSKMPAYDVAKAGVIRRTTTLGWLWERERIRVNCLVPGWIGSPPVKAYVDALTPEQRQARGVSDTLLRLEEIADAVVQLATDESLAGRVMV